MNTKLKNKNRVFILFALTSTIFFFGWGWQGHKIINYNTILSALPEMEFFNEWADSLSAHASDADYRKSVDPDEGPRHYIDIDNYPEFIQTGTIPQDFDSVVAIHGYNFVIQQGILPWAILRRIDSIQTAFEYGEWRQAMLHASDLGHYVADSHNPLHVTRNYNGQITGQDGVHFRYESDMINQFSSQITYDGDSLVYIEDLPDFVFNMIYDNYVYVDSVLWADSAATAFAGNTNSPEYYSKLWELSSTFTIELFRKASYKLTCLIYTSWINAGGPVTRIDDEKKLVQNYILSQNYPNPFNPSTKIKFTIPQDVRGERQEVTLKIYDVLGNEVATLVSGYKPASDYEVEFNPASGIINPASGIFFYQLKAGNFVETKKMILLK